jgi:hypothetical protein
MRDQAPQNERGAGIQRSGRMACDLRWYDAEPFGADALDDWVAGLAIATMTRGTRHVGRVHGCTGSRLQDRRAAREGRGNVRQPRYGSLAPHRVGPQRCDDDAPTELAGL